MLCPMILLALATWPEQTLNSQLSETPTGSSYRIQVGTRLCMCQGPFPRSLRHHPRQTLSHSVTYLGWCLAWDSHRWCWRLWEGETALNPDRLPTGKRNHKQQTSSSIFFISHNWHMLDKYDCGGVVARYCASLAQTVMTTWWLQRSKHHRCQKLKPTHTCCIPPSIHIWIQWQSLVRGSRRDDGY